MKFRNLPIQRKLMRVILLTSGIALALTCLAFLTYEFFTFRQALKTQLSTLGKIISTNSTAALAFDSPEDATEILTALRAEKHIVAACLYDENGNLFAKYPSTLSANDIPNKLERSGYFFKSGYLQGFQPVVQADIQVGTLYIKSEMKALSDRIELYLFIALLFIGVALGFAYFVSKRLQRSISSPILSLTSTAKIISDDHDYTVRAVKTGEDELGILTDAFNHMLTQIEQQNAEIMSFNTELEHKIAQRTMELQIANRELETVNNQLVKSNRDLEQFAYIASHDLQEPLRKIRTFSELAERNLGKPDNAKNYIEKVSSSAERMTMLIKAVLNYSRISKLDDGFEEINLNTIVDDIRTDFELLLIEKKAVIKSSQLPVIRGISLQIHQLFFNLISNSLKFSQENPVIDISHNIIPGNELTNYANADTNKNYLQLIFSDNGIGFEQQYADKIFTIFQRLHDKQNYPGTGIGLALCKKIVENHHGFLDVTSQPGVGTAFYIYLPL